MSYDVLKNRLTNGVPYTVEAALARINALADNLEITQEQADELIALAKQHGLESIGDEDRLTALELAVAELGVAMMTMGGANNG
ncbi:hypothetical protein B5G34_00840 [Flavonifractor sp. An82]|uniref:hypothetical protein n=1 Tax=Flavonifractor sp. An82 TaxID=1965660 RepID=UPI000B36A026|nr:hypothetical protein [Flavonifractor sp. An82]OUN23674.1 hypothetical protein B5G34_00840 [Flavonifractor sp. An82]